MTVFPKFGEIYWVNYSNSIGSQQRGIRPAVIVSNDTYNKFSPTIFTIPMTSRIGKKNPVHIFVEADKQNGLKTNGLIAVEKMQDTNKFQLGSKVGIVSDEIKDEIAKKFFIQFPMLLVYLKKQYNKKLKYAS